NGYLCKHSWIRTGSRITDSVRDGLKENKYPLFVAEGDGVKKLEQIQRSGYLSYCLSKFSRIQKALVIYGHSLSPNDSHILDSIAENIDLTNLYIGIYGDFDSLNSLEIIRGVDYIVNKRDSIIAK